jgi:hypothetical protein
MGSVQGPSLFSIVMMMMMIIIIIIIGRNWVFICFSVA